MTTPNATYSNVHSTFSSGVNGQSRFREFVATLEDKPGDTDGSRTGRSRRILGPVSAVWPKFPGLASQYSVAASLQQLGTVERYAWVSAEYFQQARRWRDAAVTIARSYAGTGYTSQTAKEAVPWLVSAILRQHARDLDLFHRQRAENASGLLAGHPAPLRRRNIPQEISQRGYTYELSLTSLQWDNGTPDEAVDRLTAVLLQAEPDRFEVATYHQRQHRLTFDPIIFAVFGGWYVKVAEWP